MILPRSLQGRLLILVIGVVAIVWLITALFIWRDARSELDELLDSHLAQAAALLVIQQTQSIDDDDTIDSRVPHPYAPKVAFQIFHEGQAVVRSANAPTGPMIPVDREIGQGFATVQINGEAWRVFSTRGPREDTRVYVGERVDSRTSILFAVLRGTLWPMAVALPLFGLATGWAVRQGVAPLKRLGRTIALRGPDDLAPVVMSQTPAEMSPVLDALNQLFVRIQTVWEAERRFTADAAHELRTPIAAIRTQAQVALAETDDTLRQHALRATLEGCDRATRLVNQLLVLSRLESGATLELTQVDLSALAQRVVAELRNAGPVISPTRRACCPPHRGSAFWAICPAISAPTPRSTLIPSNRSRHGLPHKWSCEENLSFRERARLRFERQEPGQQIRLLSGSALPPNDVVAIATKPFFGLRCVGKSLRVERGSQRSDRLARGGMLARLCGHCAVARSASPLATVRRVKELLPA
jgi:two-component system sensor histidine kinase QseC